MKWMIISLCVAFGIGVSSADTVAVTVGSIGCVGRQQAVKKQWEKIPDVISVTVLSRQAKDSAAHRTFIIVSSGLSPDIETLHAALGRRKDQYPISKYRPIEPPHK